jgi:hypothetical protein
MSELRPAAARTGADSARKHMGQVASIATDAGTLPACLALARAVQPGVSFSNARRTASRARPSCPTSLAIRRSQRRRSARRPALCPSRYPTITAPIRTAPNTPALTPTVVMCRRYRTPHTSPSRPATRPPAEAATRAFSGTPVRERPPDASDGRPSHCHQSATLRPERPHRAISGEKTGRERRGAQQYEQEATLDGIEFCVRDGANVGSCHVRVKHGSAIAIVLIVMAPLLGLAVHALRRSTTPFGST